MPVAIFGHGGCGWRRVGVNNGPAAVKGGVSVLRSTEQADKLCEGSGRRRRGVVSGTFDSGPAGHRPVWCSGLNWSFVAL